MCGCAGTNSSFPEFYKPWKAENNSGCCMDGSSRNDCSRPSLARAGSPLAKWEAIYGKLITRITFEQNTVTGHSVQVIEKVACGPTSPKRPSRHGCCSFTYRLAK
jgi:hypothetical protein